VVEGRLRLDTVDRGTYKEKRTELVAQRLHSFGVTNTPSTPNKNLSAPPVAPRPVDVPRAEPQPTFPNNADNVIPMPIAAPVSDQDYDDIPF
jgi:hypothetical protein